MIKFGIRHNLLYPMMLASFTFMRNVENILMRKLLDFNGSVILTLIMFFAEFISGLILYKYQLRMSKKKGTTLMGISLKQNSSYKSNSNSNNITLYILIFSISLFDFTEFTIINYYFPKCHYQSNTLVIRLQNLATLFSSFFYKYLLKFNIFKHQKLSILIIFFCLISIIISENFYVVNIEEYFSIIILMLVNYFFFSLIGITEKFLLEKTYINPFQMLMIEGIFGIILTSIFSIFVENPFKEIKHFYNKNKENNKNMYLVFSLFICFLLNAGKNIYRVSTNKLYSPMTIMLTESIMDPFLIIYYHICENDLSNYFWFIINIVLSFIMVFFGFVFNDFLVLYCCNLEHDTHYEISRRTSKKENNRLLSEIEVSLNDEYLVRLGKENELNNPKNLFNI